MVNKLIFTVNTNFDGTLIYELYEGLGCTGNTISYSGTTKVVNGTSNVEIDDVTVIENMSLKVIDSNGCTLCQNQNIVIPEQPEPPIEESEIAVEYIIQAYNEDLMTGGDNNATGYVTLNYVNISNVNSSVVTDGVTANREVTDTTDLATINVKSESTVQIVATNVTPTFDDNVKTIIQVYAFYPTGSTPPQLVLIDTVDIKTVGSPINTTVNLIASDGFGTRVISKYRIYITFVGFYNSSSGGSII
jgi:hypothetical protein